MTLHYFPASDRFALRAALNVANRIGVPAIHTVRGVPFVVAVSR